MAKKEKMMTLAKAQEMSFKQKINFIFKSGYAIQLSNHVMRHDGDWVDAYKWERVQLPGHQHIAGQSRFPEIEDCLNDCIKYIIKEKASKLNNKEVKEATPFES